MIRGRSEGPAIELRLPRGHARLHLTVELGGQPIVLIRELELSASTQRTVRIPALSELRVHYEIDGVLLDGSPGVILRTPTGASIPASLMALEDGRTSPYRIAHEGPAIVHPFPMPGLVEPEPVAVELVPGALHEVTLRYRSAE